MFYKLQKGVPMLIKKYSKSICYFFCFFYYAASHQTLLTNTNDTATSDDQHIPFIMPDVVIHNASNKAATITSITMEYAISNSPKEYITVSASKKEATKNAAHIQNSMQPIIINAGKKTNALTLSLKTPAPKNIDNPTITDPGISALKVNNQKVKISPTWTPVSGNSALIINYDPIKKSWHYISDAKTLAIAKPIKKAAPTKHTKNKDKKSKKMKPASAKTKE